MKYSFKILNKNQEGIWNFKVINNGALKEIWCHKTVGVESCETNCLEFFNSFFNKSDAQIISCYGNIYISVAKTAISQYKTFPPSFHYPIKTMFA